MIGTQEAAQSAETVRFIVIMIGVIVAFFWRALIRLVLVILVVIFVTTVVAGAFALTHPTLL
jgi:multisubunit Na+/H+ antiporter MnhG subunit